MILQLTKVVYVRGVLVSISDPNLILTGQIEDITWLYRDTEVLKNNS